MEDPWRTARQPKVDSWCTCQQSPWNPNFNSHGINVPVLLRSCQDKWKSQGRQNCCLRPCAEVKVDIWGGLIKGKINFTQAARVLNAHRSFSGYETKAKESWVSGDRNPERQLFFLLSEWGFGSCCISCNRQWHQTLFHVYHNALCLGKLHTHKRNSKKETQERKEMHSIYFRTNLWVSDHD